MGFTTHNLNPIEADITMRLYSSILGGGTDSLLFKTVREKLSLCYSIDSSYSHLSNLLSIRTAINNQNYDLTVAEIKKVIAAMSQGKFSVKLLNNCKKDFINTLKAYDDSLFSLTSEYINRIFQNQKEIHERIITIKTLTKEDVIKVSKKINLDVIFFLETGDDNGKV